MRSPDKVPSTAIMLVSCPDRRGIVAAIADFLYAHNANIVHADQHQDAEQGLFLMRVEWDLEGFDLSIDDFVRHFAPIAARFEMDWRVAQSSVRQRVAVFVSREQHCLVDLLARHAAGELSCEIPLIIGNHTDASEIAAFYRIPFYHIPVAPSDKSEAEAAAQALLRENRIDLVVLARYMQILSANFLRAATIPMINIHHSFLPAFAGARPYHQAYNRGVKLIGATSHYVTPVLDDGPIIEQDVTRVSHRDDVNDLVRMGRDLEKVVLARAVRWHLEHRILAYANRTVIFD